MTEEVKDGVVTDEGAAEREGVEIDEGQDEQTKKSLPPGIVSVDEETESVVIRLPASMHPEKVCANKSECRQILENPFIIDGKMYASDGRRAVAVDGYDGCPDGPIPLDAVTAAMRLKYPYKGQMTVSRDEVHVDVRDGVRYTFKRDPEGWWAASELPPNVERVIPSEFGRQAMFINGSFLHGLLEALGKPEIKMLPPDLSLRAASPVLITCMADGHRVRAAIMPMIGDVDKKAPVLVGKGLLRQIGRLLVRVKPMLDDGDGTEVCELIKQLKRLIGSNGSGDVSVGNNGNGKVGEPESAAAPDATNEGDE